MDVCMETEDCTPVSSTTSNSYQPPSQFQTIDKQHTPQQLLPEYPDRRNMENKGKQNFSPPVNGFDSDGLKRKRGGLNINYLADCKRRKI